MDEFASMPPQGHASRPPGSSPWGNHGDERGPSGDDQHGDGKWHIYRLFTYENMVIFEYYVEIPECNHKWFIKYGGTPQIVDI